jgi:DNA-binding IclR family transcriptional regulator
MKQWDKINWPALNRRAVEIEAELWQWSLAQRDPKEKGVAAPITQADRATLRALMVWCDDGGSAT